jgi:hypothetical protein
VDAINDEVRGTGDWQHEGGGIGDERTDEQVGERILDFRYFDRRRDSWRENDGRGVFERNMVTIVPTPKMRRNKRCGEPAERFVASAASQSNRPSRRAVSASSIMPSRKR